jgi:hypothetical protein
VKTYTQLAMWCRRGHPMTDDNIRFGRSGEPECKECLRIHLAAVREWKQQKGIA